jgi:hypothetical protein
MAIRYRPRNLRILSLMRKRLRRRPASPATILTEAGDQLKAENGNYLRTEQN